MNSNGTIRERAPWLVALTLAAMFVVAAADRPLPRVAIVDAERIRQESVYIKGKLAIISKPADAIKTQMIEKQTALKTAAEAYQAQSSAMSDAAKESKMKELNQLKADVTALSQSFDNALTKAGNEDLEAMRQEIMGLVGKVAAERSIDIVLSTANVLYNAKEVELTDEVIRRLDAAKGANAPGK